jgi:uncharacterized protein DUF2511
MVVLAVAFPVGCGSESSPPSSGEGDSSPSKDTRPSVEPDSAPGELSATDVPKGDWPLTVPRGTVRCEGSGDVGQVTFLAGGKEYAVNGLAQSQRPELPKIDVIWKDDPDIPGAKIDISPILNAGLKQCG